MTRRVYQFLFLASLIICTALFIKEVKTNLVLFAHVDKVVHFIIFFGLAFILHHAFRLPVWLHLVLLAFYGASIEVLQSFVPYRQASFADFVADMAGAIVYFAGYYGWTKATKKTR